MTINTQNTKTVKNAITIPNLLTLQGILYNKTAINVRHHLVSLRQTLIAICL